MQGPRAEGPGWQGARRGDSFPLTFTGTFSYDAAESILKERGKGPWRPEAA